LGGGPRGGAQVAVVLVEDRTQRVAAVAQQMPPVGDLDGVRRTPRGSVGIGAGAVADHDRDARVPLQPRRQGVGAAVGQQVDDPSALEIAQDGAVAPALAPSPVVHAEHTDRWDRLGIAGTDAVQQRRAADRHAQGGGVARAGVAAEC
jgi:hypothetical protein